jgi:hypothetical protein
MQTIDLSNHPPPTQLWQGVVLATIANAINSAANDSHDSGRTWRGPHYWANDDQSAFGIVGFREPSSFLDKQLVGLLCDRRSERWDWDGTTLPDWGRQLAGMPADLRAWAERDLLRHMVYETLDDAEQTPITVITAAFWCDGEQLRSAESFASMMEHGGHVLNVEFMPFEDAFACLDEDYGFSDGDEDELLTLLRGLYQRKMADPHTPIRMRPWEQEALESYGGNGLQTAREMLAAVGIILP